MVNDEVWHIPAYGYRDFKHPFCGATGAAYDRLAYGKQEATCPACLMKLLSGQDPTKARISYDGTRTYNFSRLPDINLTRLSDEEKAWLILAGYPTPFKCSNCEHYARQRPQGTKHHSSDGALCVCCIGGGVAGLANLRPYIYECDGRVRR